MIDFAKITVIAGDGGSGSGSFFHIKGKRLGKADGGDGGRGGDVYLEATGDLNTLEPFRYVKEYKGKDGVNGLSRKRKGADGEDLVIKVSVGTTVRVLGPVTSFPPAPSMNSGQAVLRVYPERSRRAVGNPSHSCLSQMAHPSESKTRTVTQNSQLITYDLTEAGQGVLIARGGEGGRGNAHLRDEFGRRPKAGEKGQEGEQVNLTLELKLIADIGLIGFPNAGKSTLLAALTSAKPKVADYPFTTLEPNLGVMSASRIQGLASRETKSLNANSLGAKRSIVIADIPGLIKGASEGKGLGDLFLRHIERTKILVHLIDVSGESVKWQDYQTIRQELKSYSKELVKKREIIVLTKIDLVSKQRREEVLNLFKSKKKKVLSISAVSGQGLNDILETLRGQTSNRGLTSDT